MPLANRTAETMTETEKFVAEALTQSVQKAQRSLARCLSYRLSPDHPQDTTNAAMRTQSAMAVLGALQQLHFEVLGEFVDGPRGS